MQLHTKLEANKLPIKFKTGNRTLTDLTIDECQKILRNKFYPLYRLEDTGLGKKLMLKKQTGEFVQILHNGNYHCVVLSNIIYRKNERGYYEVYFMVKSSIM